MVSVSPGSKPGIGASGGSLKYTKREVVGFALFGLFYFVWFGLLIGLTTVNVLAFPLLFLLYFGNRMSRQALLTFAPLILYVFLYDSCRVLRRIDLFTVHTGDIYRQEVRLFGVYLNGTKVSLNEYFAANPHTLFDIIAGMSYITWIPFPAIFSAFLFIRGHRELAFRFWVAMFFTTSFGFVLYVCVPAAPPWYYLRYGDAPIDPAAHGDPGGLARFDALTGIPMYAAMYSQNQNVFAAMPSMHAAFPTALTFYGAKYGCKPLTALFAASALGIWFGAVYASHHYVLDLLAGVGCCVCGVALTEFWFKQSAGRKDSLLNRYLKRITEGTVPSPATANGHSHAGYLPVAMSDVDKVT